LLLPRVAADIKNREGIRGFFTFAINTLRSRNFTAVMRTSQRLTGLTAALVSFFTASKKKPFQYTTILSYPFISASAQASRMCLLAQIPDRIFVMAPEIGLATAFTGQRNLVGLDDEDLADEFGCLLIVNRRDVGRIQDFGQPPHAHYVVVGLGAMGRADRQQESYCHQYLECASGH
jgi:hypothetical protein